MVLTTLRLRRISAWWARPPDGTFRNSPLLGSNFGELRRHDPRMVEIPRVDAPLVFAVDGAPAAAASPAGSYCRTCRSFAPRPSSLPSGLLIFSCARASTAAASGAPAAGPAPFESQPRATIVSRHPRRRRSCSSSLSSRPRPDSPCHTLGTILDYSPCAAFRLSPFPSKLVSGTNQDESYIVCLLDDPASNRLRLPQDLRTPRWMLRPGRGAWKNTAPPLSVPTPA